MLILFYNKNIGLNLFIFNIFLIVSSLVLTKNISRQIILSIICCLISSSTYVYYGDATSIFANILSIGIFSILIHENKRSIVLYISHTICKLIMSPYNTFTALISKKEDIIGFRKQDLIKKLIFYILFPGIILFIFVLLYMQINPVLCKFVSSIDTNLPSAKFIFSILFYYILMYTFWNKKSINFYSKIDCLSVKELKQHNKTLKDTYLLKSGIISFTLLNILIISLLFSDFNYIVLQSELPDSMSLSEYVHAGVNASIFSIIFAISLIMIFLKGDINFSPKVRPLLYLCSVWIGLNIILALSICVKNSIYISSYGLTEKRIGVFIYTFIACMALIICLIKILHKKSNLFLIRNMYWTIIIVLVSMGTINWSQIISNHNIKAYKNGEIKLDINYLCRLNSYNIGELLQVYKHKTLEKNKQEEINSKICKEINKIENNDFLSYIFYDKLNTDLFSKTDTRLKSYTDFNAEKLPYNNIKCLKNISSVSINNNYTIDELNVFFEDKLHIKRLTINANTIKQLPKIAKPLEVKYINTLYNRNISLTNICKFKNIESLYIYQIKEEESHLLKELSKLKKIHVKIYSKEIDDSFPNIQITKYR